MKHQIINGVDHMLLYHCNLRIKNPNKHEREEKTFLINSLFEKSDEPTAEEVMQSDEPGRELSLDDFYERLRLAHENDDLETDLPTEVQHPFLRPQLRPYQKRGIKWMLKRELQTEELPPHFIKLRSKFNRDQIYYFNKYTQELLRDCPPCNVIPSGGLLTDEMGLGKTVEVIGLMLMNPRRSGIKRKIQEEIDKPKSTKIMVKCICHKKVKKKYKVVRCSRCATYQHLRCVFQGEVSEADREDYICPLCWKLGEMIIDSPTTVIKSANYFSLLLIFFNYFSDHCHSHIN